MPDTATRSIAMLFFAGFVAYAYNNAFMVLSPLYAMEVGGTVFDAGLQGTVFMVAAIILRFFFGPLADRHGVKPIMVLGLSAFAATAFLMAFCDRFWTFVLLRCIQSIGLAAFFPCATAAVAMLAPSGKTGFYLGLYRFVSSASLLVGPSMAFALVGASGYRQGFCAMAACTLVAGILVFGISLERPKKLVRADGSACEKLHLRDKNRKRLRAGARSLVHALGSAFPRSPWLIAGVLGMTFIAALGYGLLFGFAAPYIGIVLPDINSGLYFTLIGVGGLVANPIAGWASDRMPRAKILSFLFVCMGLGIFSLGFLTLGSWALFLSGLLMGFGYFGSMTTVLAVIAAGVADDCRSSVLSLQQNGIDLGIACASGGFGLAISLVGDAAFVFAFQGAAAMLSGLAIALFSRARYSDR